MCYDVIAGGHCNQIFGKCCYTTTMRSINTIGGGLLNCKEIQNKKYRREKLFL